jgi:hypothetical protein
MKILIPIEDINHMSVTSPPFLATSSTRSIKDCIFLHFQKFNNLLNRCDNLNCLLIPA